jgi:DNA polymerase-3 subunit delta
MKGQLARWPADKLATALDLLLAAELDCKTTGMPAPEICGRAILQLTRAAGRR